MKLLTGFCRSWFLNTNLDKTKVCTFHLNYRAASGKLRIMWEGKELENTTHPVYLCVTLDRTLSFKEHVAMSSGGKYPPATTLSTTLPTPAGVLTFTPSSILRWRCAVQQLSTALQYGRGQPICILPKSLIINLELNRACCTITGTLKATPLQAIRYLST